MPACYKPLVSHRCEYCARTTLTYRCVLTCFDCRPYPHAALPFLLMGVRCSSGRPKHPRSKLKHSNSQALQSVCMQGVWSMHAEAKNAMFVGGTATASGCICSYHSKPERDCQSMVKNTTNSSVLYNPGTRNTTSTQQAKLSTTRKHRNASGGTPRAPQPLTNI